MKNQNNIVFKDVSNSEQQVVVMEIVVGRLFKPSPSRPWEYRHTHSAPLAFSYGAVIANELDRLNGVEKK